MPELLLEVGCEELPASFVRKSVAQLQTRVRELLAEAGLLGEASGAEDVAFGTPRRMIVSFPYVKERQADETKEMRGPAVKGAFGADGMPTNALLGFCRGQGVDLANIRNDGAYVWVSKHIAGQPAAQLLGEILTKAIRGLTFDKAMRWGSGRQRFARPIRWILASFDGQVIPFEVEGVAAGTESRGHRFYAPAPFTALTAKDLIAGLRDRFVEPDPEVREFMIRDGIANAAEGVPIVEDDLVDENVFLTEWPTAIEGTFPESLLNLPEPVLIIAMAKHERMFPVRSEDGKLTNRFVFIRNSGEDETVRRGSEWVLNARFNDARFFFAQDQKFGMEDFLAQTERIVFQEKLGTVRARADRLVRLAGWIADATGASSEERALAETAAKFAKADLATGLVSELSSLQGAIGAEYAAREGFAPGVVLALATQYDLSKIPAEDTPETRTALRLSIVDQLDKLAGYLGSGLEPTGSSDPFGLRRCATVLIEAAWRWNGALPPYDEMLDAALGIYRDAGLTLDAAGAQAAFADVFRARYTSLLPDVRFDILEAAKLPDHPWEVTLPQGVRFRTEVLAQLAGNALLVQTATRPLNLVAAAKKKGLAYAFEDPLRHVTPDALDSDLGHALLELTARQEDAVFRAARERDVAGLATLIEGLVEPVNAFLEGTMIMVDEEAVRFARLTLLHAVSLQFLAAGDFTRIE